MSRRNIRWLYSQLPSLVEEDVVSEDTAGRLRERYGDPGNFSARTVALALCAILGASLIGGGCILLFGHNWQELPRFARAAMSFTLLLAAQLIVLKVLRKDKPSVGLREASAIFLTLSVGATIALIGQTYHIPGDLGSFLIVWMLLVVPLVYLLRAVTPAIVYCIGITFWAGYEQDAAGHAFLFWPLFAAVLPHVWLELKEDRYSVRSALLGWVTSLCLCVATGIVLEKVMPGLWIVVYSGLLATLYLAGSRWFDEPGPLAARPYFMVGSAGIAVLSLILTFEFAWDDVGWYHYRYQARFHEWAAAPDYLLAAALPITAISLLVTTFRKGERGGILPGALPVVATVCYFLVAFTDTGMLPMIVFNIYMLLLGIWTVTHGIRAMRLGHVNGGMLILSALIVSRFFDSDLGLAARGIVFIMLGGGFLAGNIILARRMKKEVAS